MKIALAITLFLSFTPALSFAAPTHAAIISRTRRHTHVQTTHDRTPKARTHTSRPHISD
jgi:hypothetical protein